MIAEVALFEVLSNDPGVSALVAGRIYPMTIPEGQDVYPALVWSVISAPADQTQNGLGLLNPRVQVDVWARKYLDVAQAAAVVIAALNRRIGSGLQSSQLIGMHDDRDVQTGLYRRILEFSQWWEVAA